jgi:SAM-dependent methyltransferase
MREWIDWYDSNHTIYANARHKDVHFRHIAEDMARYVPKTDAVVLDYGCGEALHADIVAAAAGKLILAESAPGVRARIAARFAGSPKITVCATEDTATLPDHSIDLAVMHSVSQYMTPDELDVTLKSLRRLLVPSGLLVLGDVLAPNISAPTDAIALLKFGLKDDFFVPAGISLARTFFSSYWSLRTSLGLTRYDDATMIAKLAACGFASSRQRQNIGHNAARMTFVGRPA